MRQSPGNSERKRTPKRTIRLEPAFDLSDTLGRGEVVAFNVGPEGVLYVVVALKRLDYRKDRGGASFAKIIPDEPQEYRVIGISSGQIVLDVSIARERFNIHDVQPLPQKQFLLVCGRSAYRGPDDYDKNGRVYSRAGELVREILLGDGIETVQATSTGTIWTSYFDEGVFGNYGWDDPVGAPGLIAWDAQGRRLYEFEPPAGLDTMCDCYALNVAADNEVWCYYYTEFPLVRIRRGRFDGIWWPSVKGSRALAVENSQALFSGGYKARDTYCLLELKPGEQTEVIADIEFLDERGEKLVADRIVGRGPSLHVLRASKIYRAEVSLVRESLRAES